MVLGPRLSSVRLECAWAGILSLFQAGIAVSITVSSLRDLCQTSGDWAMRASRSLLVPVSWLNTFVVVSYFFTLAIAATVHASTCPNIWKSSVCNIDWFGFSGNRLDQNGVDRKNCSDLWSDHLDEMEPTCVRKHVSNDPEKAPWAKGNNMRRGIDHPFLIRRDQILAPRDTPTMVDMSLPAVPVRAHARDPRDGSRFIENVDDQQQTARATPCLAIALEEHDLPIPLPSKSEWVRADVIARTNENYAHWKRHAGLNV
ncbi:hypothetical protein AX17_003545 [Amanita inopinata Kibby_2008]|nr:hypothetical protein AX17_003545 [Amanita inopinata Kibby_2008]